MHHFAMNNTLENAFADLGLGDSDSDDMITPVGPIGRASRRHSYDPYGRLSDGEAAHYDTPNPSGKALMYDDSDSEEEGYPPVGSKGYPRGGTEFPSSHKRGVSSAHGSHYIKQARLQGSQSLYLGVSQGSVIRCSSPVEDHDFVPPSENFRDPITHGSYVAHAPGSFPTVKSASTTSKSKGHFFDTPQPLPTASGVLAPQTLVFNSPPTQGQLPHPSTPAGPAPQPTGSQHASLRGEASIGTMHLDRGNDHVAPRSAQPSDL